MTPTTKFVAKSVKKITLKSEKKKNLSEEVLAEKIDKSVEAKLFKKLGNIILNHGGGF